MLERLGLVLYWLGCALAVIAVLLGVSFFTTGLDLVGYDIGKLLALVLWVGAVLVWLVGRWLRFILSARSTSEEAPDWDTGTDDPP